MRARVELFVISIITDAELLNCFGVIRISASYVLTSRTQLGLIYYALIVGFLFSFFWWVYFFFFLIGWEVYFLFVERFWSYLECMT